MPQTHQRQWLITFYFLFLEHCPFWRISSPASSLAAEILLSRLQSALHYLPLLALVAIVSSRLTRCLDNDDGGSTHALKLDGFAELNCPQQYIGLGT